MKPRSMRGGPAGSSEHGAMRKSPPPGDSTVLGGAAGIGGADLGEASVGQILIPVEDLDRAVAFYRDTLGLPFLFTAPPQMSFFQAGGVRLLVGVPEGDRAGQRGSALYFRVADIGAVYRTLLARGVQFTAEPHLVYRGPHTDLWLSEFRDPDGNALALMSEVRKEEG